MPKRSTSSSKAPATELTGPELEALRQLLEGKPVSLQAATRLVKRSLCVWQEPHSEDEPPEPVLTSVGHGLARELWPDLNNLSGPIEPVFAYKHGNVSRQIPLDFHPAVERPRPAVVEALGGLLGNDALAAAVLEQYPQGRGLGSASGPALRALGLSSRQAALVRHAFALVRACRSTHELETVRNPDDMAQVVWARAHVEELEVECVWIVALDGHRRVLTVDKVAQGSSSCVRVSLRDVVAPVLRARASAAYLAHNHPSGQLRWSSHDEQLTQRVAQAFTMFGVEFLNHIVLAPDGTYLGLEITPTTAS